MISYIVSVFNYIFFSKDNKVEDDILKEELLAEGLLDLELTQRFEEDDDTFSANAVDIPRNAKCFQRTGVITFIEGNSSFIDGTHYFDLSLCTCNVNVDDKVLYLGYKNNEDTIIVVRILENYGLSWNEDGESDVEEKCFQVQDHVMIGEVEYREDRNVFIRDSDLKFSLDDVEGTLVPIAGDWLELKCSVQLDEDNPSDISTAQVLKVISFKPLRKKIKPAVITEWHGEQGTCDRILYLNKYDLPPGFIPRVGAKVLIEAIESNQGNCSWRVIKLIPTGKTEIIEAPVIADKVETSLQQEKELNLEVTHPLIFDKININETATITLQIYNKSDQVHIINKWVILSKKRDSQIFVTPLLTKPYRLYPQQAFKMTITCQPRFFGNTKEHLIIMLRHMKIERMIEINVVDDSFKNNNMSNGNDTFGKEYIKSNILSNHEKLAMIKKDEHTSYVPGVKPIKPANFISVRLAMYPIPNKVWSVVLGDSKQVVFTHDYEKVIKKIEDTFPCLMQELNIGNYIDKWHTLLYMEEVQENLNIRVYDMPKVFLIRCQEYLGIEVEGLCERRPSLLLGDRVIVKDIWYSKSQKYEGYIHQVRGNLVLVKFHQQFHESYSGTDVSIEFHFSRMKYRKAHNAINEALSILGPDILFPKSISYQSPKLPPEKLQSIQWYNNILNDGQKAAVLNILSGDCRPKPYCIYGPPGTGKTVTVIETILQILTLFPDSRILVATPANSASNLITQRLIQYKEMLSNSFVRILANYLVDSDTVPSEIKPYCITVDLAREDTVKSKQAVQSGINTLCPKSFVGRHRVTIGTCYSLGSLKVMGFPKGHFTHVIVDEVGQATEPEVMIPLTLIDKDNGQIILAGDPMQLGPVVLSRYCIEFGMNESYLSRLLETFPYHKDYVAYKQGFNDKLVTKLTHNYRSLENVIRVPSEMFYDGSLVPKIDPEQIWIKSMLGVISKIFNMNESEAGGIYVYGIKGCNARAEDSPSWFNPHEASMVALTACKLLNSGNITTDDIGIITPYVAQVKHLRTIFDSMGLEKPKIGSVEEFQGQERPIIILSTVRSTESLVSEDIKSALGFIKNSKRVNVALTRAQVAVIIFCNPHLLCKDPLWFKVISSAVKEDKYIGCDLPNIDLTFN